MVEYTEKERDFIQARLQYHSRFLAKELGRTEAEIKAIRKDMTHKRRLCMDRIEPIIRAHWGKMTTQQIAMAAKCDAGTVFRHAKMWGLGPGLAAENKAVVAPSRPKGFTREQHEWALANPTHREAGLIFCMIGDPAARGLG